MNQKWIKEEPCVDQPQALSTDVLVIWLGHPQLNSLQGFRLYLAVNLVSFLLLFCGHLLIRTVLGNILHSNDFSKYFLGGEIIFIYFFFCLASLLCSPLSTAIQLQTVQSEFLSGSLALFPTFSVQLLFLEHNEYASTFLLICLSLCSFTACESHRFVCWSANIPYMEWA